MKYNKSNKSNSFNRSNTSDKITKAIDNTPVIKAVKNIKGGEETISYKRDDFIETFYLQYRDAETNNRVYKNADDADDEDHLFIAEYNPRFWYPSSFFYDAKKNIMTTSLGSRINLAGEFIHRKSEPSLATGAPHHYISYLVSTKRIDGLTYRIIRQEKQTKANYVLDIKYYLFETDGGYNFHTGDQVEITKGGFLHKVGEENDVFDEPILESAQLHKVNIRHISWSSGQVHSYTNDEAVCKREFYHIKLTDESGDWYTINFKTKEDLDRVYKEMTDKDTIFLVAKDFGLFYVNGKMPNTCTENKLQYTHTEH